jgi:hypothetical protein
MAAAGGAIDIPPESFRENVDAEGITRGPACVTLDYGDNLPNPIRDMEIEADGIRATLSFQGEGRKTFVPWGNIFLIMLPDEGFVARWTLKVDDLKAPTEKVPEKRRLFSV